MQVRKSALCLTAHHCSHKQTLFFCNALQCQLIDLCNLCRLLKSCSYNLLLLCLLFLLELAMTSLASLDGVARFRASGSRTTSPFMKHLNGYVERIHLFQFSLTPFEYVCMYTFGCMSQAPMQCTPADGPLWQYFGVICPRSS